MYYNIEIDKTQWDPFTQGGGTIGVLYVLTRIFQYRLKNKGVRKDASKLILACFGWPAEFPVVQQAGSPGTRPVRDIST